MYHYILMTTNIHHHHYYSCGVVHLFNMLIYVDYILKPR